MGLYLVDLNIYVACSFKYKFVKFSESVPNRDSLIGPWLEGSPVVREAQLGVWSYWKEGFLYTPC